MSAACFTIGQAFNPYGRFTGIYVPEAICKYHGVSLGAKMVYGRLCRYAGEDGKAYPAVGTLGKELGISGKQARRYVRELEAKQFILADRQPGQSSRYMFLWHRAFTDLSANLHEGDAPLPKTGVLTPPIDGSTPLPHVGAKENQLRESIKENHHPTSVRSAVGLWCQPQQDDDSLLSLKTENQNPSEIVVAESLRAAVEAWGIPTPKGKRPDREITELLAKMGATVEDLAGFLYDDFRGKRGGNPATWKYLLVAVQHWAADPKVLARLEANRILAEQQKADIEARIQKEGERLERERVAQIVVAPVDAIALAGKVPDGIRRRLIRLGQPITPAKVIEMVREHHNCKPCDGTGLIGFTLDRTRRFCECIAGDELQHEDPERPAQEIEHAHASLKNRLVAAAQSIGGCLADAIESSTVTETPLEVIFSAPKGYRLYFEDKHFPEVMKVAGEQRSVRLVAT